MNDTLKLTFCGIITEMSERRIYFLQRHDRFCLVMRAMKIE